MILMQAPSVKQQYRVHVQTTLMEVQSNISLICRGQRDLRNNRLENQAILVLRETFEITLSNLLILHRPTLELRAVK